MARKLIGYVRVSTAQQGKSGLVIEAQKQALERFATTEGFDLIKVYVEVETGKAPRARARARRRLRRQTSTRCLGDPFFWPAAGGGASWRGAAVARRGLARLGPSSARLSAACGVAQTRELTAMARKLIGYVRVSTAQQGKSGLVIEAQKQALERFATTEGFDLIKVYVEVETGKAPRARARARRRLRRQTSTAPTPRRLVDM